MPEDIQKKLIEKEMQESYVDYAMSVIVARALPDVRDGLKPVHRRVLYAMNELGLASNKPSKKAANVVGQVLGKYHPHGDQSVYDALVRLAQPFSLRGPLVKGQGNFGSIDGDPAAAMRYTEAKLSKLAEEMLEDIQKNTVDFAPNYDNSTKEPIVLPAKLPNLLLNGSTGIAVGMATNIPPHNLTEVCETTIQYINNPEIEITDLIEFLPGPDFPTGGIICGKSGIKTAYHKGKGKVTVRGKIEVEEKNNKTKLIISEIPYMVNKTNLITGIADKVNNKIIQGISDIRDESDRDGMRIVIELKKDSNPDVVLNNLYKNSQLQTTFGITLLALYDNQPHIMNLKDILKHYVDHRIEVITRRTQFDLDKAEKRAHILEGLKIALNNIDEVVKTIKASKNQDLAKESLMNLFKLTEIQSQAILDMRLGKLTSLEQEKIDNEYNELQKLIQELKELLASHEKMLNVIKEELESLKQKFGDERRTEIIDVETDIEDEDLIPEEEVVVTVTHSGYIKKTPLDLYKQQKRGGTGIKGTQTKEEDLVENLFTTSNHNYLLCFSNKGKVYWMKAYQVPTASRYSKGKAIINLLRLGKEERITTVIPVAKFNDQHFLLMATKKGLIKKTNLVEYSRPRKGGIAAITLKEKDELVAVKLTPGFLNMIIGTKNGLAIKFSEKDARPMGRTATGVRGIRLSKEDEVVGLEVALDTASLLTVTENGYGKRTPLNEYRLIKRGGKGVINIQTTERNGNVVGIKTVRDDDEILIMSAKGVIIRTSSGNISKIGRNTQGVRLMRLKENDKVNTLARIINDNGDE